MTAGTTSLLTTLAAALTVPLGAAIVLAPVAALLLSKGIDAFCSMDTAATSPAADKADAPAQADTTASPAGE
jgi:hypothetical protein